MPHNGTSVFSAAPLKSRLGHSPQCPANGPPKPALVAITGFALFVWFAPAIRSRAHDGRFLSRLQWRLTCNRTPLSVPQPHSLLRKQRPAIVEDAFRSPKNIAWPSSHRGLSFCRSYTLCGALSVS